MFRFEHRTVALVTGGGTGIGLGIARELASAGAAVALTGRRAEVVEAAAASLRQEGAEAISVSADVSQPEDCRRAVSETVEKLGALHVLVNNAGIAKAGPVEEMSEADVHALVDIDLKGPIWMLQAALPELEKQAAGVGASVINISSSVTVSPVPFFSIYSAAKAGLDMLTKCWARDLAPRKIRVNGVCPGVVETSIHANTDLEQMAGMTPLGRVGQPADVAALALYLASPASQWMTGAVIPIDGGLSLAG